MEQRMRHRLRRLIELSVEAVARGFMPMTRAAETMEAAGAPFEVVCRVLMPFKDGVPRSAGRTDAESGGGYRPSDTVSG